MNTLPTFDQGMNSSNWKAPRQVSTSLKLTMEELRHFLSTDNPEFAPPEGDQKQKELNLLMASIVMIRLFDAYKRRTRQELWDAMTDVRDSVAQFGDGAGAYPVLSQACLALCNQLSKESEKLCPVPMETIKLMVLALADLGLVRPARMELSASERKEFFKRASEMGLVIAESDQTEDKVRQLHADHFKTSILNTRAVLYAMASQLGSKLEKPKVDSGPESVVIQD